MLIGPGAQEIAATLKALARKSKQMKENKSQKNQSEISEYSNQDMLKYSVQSKKEVVTSGLSNHRGNGRMPC